MSPNHGKNDMFWLILMVRFIDVYLINERVFNNIKAFRLFYYTQENICTLSWTL